jgi:hypothetical protein
VSAAKPMKPTKAQFGNHKWIETGPVGRFACSYCGIIKRRDGKNDHCPGSVRIGLRDQPNRRAKP